MRKKLSRRSAFQFLLAAASIAAPYLFMRSGWSKFPYTFIIIILFILGYWLISRKDFAQLGFRRIISPIKFVALILLVSIGLELLMDWIVQPLINKLFTEIPDYSYFSVLEHQTPKYFKYLLYMWISAAGGEELLFRAFMFAQLKKIIPTGRYQSLIILIIPAIFFSLAHAYEGPAGIAITFIWGLIFGTIYQRSRNIWFVIGVHGCIDMIFLTLAYTGHLSYYEWPNKWVWGS